MSKKNHMRCERIAGNIVFTLPEKDLLSGVKHMPNGPVKVTDKEKFLKAFVRNFMHMVGDGEEEAINDFIDRIVLECAESDEGVVPMSLDEQDAEY